MRVVSRVEIPARAMDWKLRVQVDRVPPWYQAGMSVELEPDKELPLIRGVMASRTWGQMEDGTCEMIVQLVNPHDDAVTLEPHDPVGRLIPVDVQPGAPLILLNREEVLEAQRIGGPDAIAPCLLQAGGALTKDGTVDLTMLVLPDAEGDGAPPERTHLVAEDGDLEQAMPAGVDFAERPPAQPPERGFENLAASQGTPEERRKRIRAEAIVAQETDMSEEDKAAFVEIMVAHYEVFSDQPGYSTVGELAIPTGSGRPVARKPFRNPLVANEGFMKQLREWEDAGIIRRSQSAWAAPVLLVPKKNGKWRTVIDYRGLNKLITPEENPVPLISTVLDSVGVGNVFTTLDLTSGYYQLPVKEEDRHKTAFTTPYGLWEFNRCPQGISNAVPTFQRTMELLLRRYLGVSVLVYLDDVIIFSPTVEQHKKDVDGVLQLIKEAGMTLRLSKCRIACGAVEYLGHVITKDGVKMCEDKVEAVRKFPVPTDATGVRSFLGVANFYRKFIKNFSVTARPLHQLTKKGAEFQWGSTEEDTFELLKHKLCTAPVLRYPDMSRPFELHVDACAYMAAGRCYASVKMATRRRRCTSSRIGVWCSTGPSVIMLQSNVSV